jgi:hypothetical protein
MDQSVANQSVANQSVVNQSVVNQSVVNHSVVNESIVDQSVHNKYFSNDANLTILQEDDENFGMKSKADDFFLDSEEEGEISLDASEQA